MAMKVHNEYLLLKMVLRRQQRRQRIAVNMNVTKQVTPKEIA